ncbi:unnamed protein product [Prorocentrum cordatum]|uniref:Mei2-like C-terminal RNA recognition motif domain-containing protein n=1 Tax=Prorocentrum cordatum TaxID=2364126 RepID=A0ABN9UMV6_9DINO|nr:unnamed protein product [Polarella glacialis]
MASGATIGKMNSPITTLMLRNLPRRYTQEQLLREIQDVVGTTVDYNLLYVPWDSRDNCNVGYAFLNCCDAEGAERCRMIFNGYYFCRSAKQKQCSVFTAHIQGLESNLIHLLTTSMGVLATGGQPDKNMPVIIWQGQRVRFQKVVAALQRADAPVGHRPLAQPCGSAGPLFWSDTALPQERAPWPEATTARRLFASNEGTTAPWPPAPAPEKSAAEGKWESAASTTTPGFVSEASTQGLWSHASFPRCGRYREGDVGEEYSSPDPRMVSNDGHFSLMLAEDALVQRIGAAMAERRLALPHASEARAALLERRVAAASSPLLPASSGAPPAAAPPQDPRAPPHVPEPPPEARPTSGQPQAGLRRSPGLERGAPARPAGGAVEGEARPPTAAADGTRILELGNHLSSRVFEKFFEKHPNDPGGRPTCHAGSGASVGRSDGAGRQVADQGAGSPNIFSL